MLDKTGKDSSNYNAENIRLIQEASPFVGQWIEKEYERQKNNVELIASENYCSDAILAACGSCLSRGLSATIIPCCERMSNCARASRAFSSSGD